MKKLDPAKNIHFVGIGGTGMSGLASIMHSLGYPVSGSDPGNSPVIEKLKNIGLKIFSVHNSANISGDTQLVVRSAAINDDNPEVFAAGLREIPVIKYAQMLGYIMDLKKGIAVSGTHGKTTTSSMIAFILNSSEVKAGYVIGGIVPQLNGSSSSGDGDLFVAEACEYDRSFLNLRPYYAIINNIEEDHLDYFKDLSDIKDAFINFVKNIKKEGKLFYSSSSENIKDVIKHAECECISYGFEKESYYKGENYRIDKNANTVFDVIINGEKKVKIRLGLFGKHNAINALAAFALCYEAGIPEKQIISALKEFTGVKRRFEIIYNKGFMLVDDYAHHPTEIQTVLKYTKAKYSKNRIITVFQPHQHSRTRFLLDDFARSFSDSDIIIVPDIYFVRDSEIEKKMISSRDLMKKIVSNSGNAFYIPSLDEIEKFLRDNIMDDDIIIFMGAGNINEIALNLKKTFEE